MQATYLAATMRGPCRCINRTLRLPSVGGDGVASLSRKRAGNRMEAPSVSLVCTLVFLFSATKLFIFCRTKKKNPEKLLQKDFTSQVAMAFRDFSLNEYFNLNRGDSGST
jgi:hypothetical protein